MNGRLLSVFSHSLKLARVRVRLSMRETLIGIRMFGMPSLSLQLLGFTWRSFVTSIALGKGSGLC